MGACNGILGTQKLRLRIVSI